MLSLQDSLTAREPHELRSILCIRFPLHSPKVSSSGLDQKSAFTGIVWQLLRLAALRSGLIPFLAVFAERQAEAPCPSAPAERKHTSFPHRLIPLSPRHTALLPQHERPQRPLQKITFLTPSYCM